MCAQTTFSKKFYVRINNSAKEYGKSFTYTLDNLMVESGKEYYTHKCGMPKIGCQEFFATYLATSHKW